MGKKTPLYHAHGKADAKIVDFAGWDMPLHYGSQLDEHHQIRRDAGMFDVSHMVCLDVRGPEIRAFLRWVLANDVDRLKTLGKALYTCMLNEKGGVLDDLIVYKLEDQFYRLIVNAGTREKDIAWLTQQAKPFDVSLTPRDDLSMLAIQGPEARNKTADILPPEKAEAVRTLKPFNAALLGDWMIARTGYTGEDGLEILLPNSDVERFWEDLLHAGVKPCGLGARDTLRLEAGMNLYGTDMDESTSPLVSNLAWTIAWIPEDRDFIGRSALTQQRAEGIPQRLVGIVLQGKGILRNHQSILVEGIGEGEVTSGSFSPTLKLAIGLARVPAETGAQCMVKIRDKWIPADVVNLPFVRHGKKVFTSLNTE